MTLPMRTPRTPGRPDRPPGPSPGPARPGRRSRGVALAGLGGFVLGAATVLLVVWLYGRAVGFPPAPPPPATTERGTTGRPGPAPSPTTAAPGSETAPPPPAPLPPPAPGTSPTAGLDLAQRGLLLPVAGVRPGDLHDTFAEARGSGRVHEAIDILAPRNTPVLAVEDGRVAKLFTSAQGGLTVYQFDPASTYAYYYAHLERYAPGLKEGDPLRRGQVLGYVGTSGNAPKDTPHLHFAIFRLGPEKHWWQGTAVNPYPFLHGADPAPARPAR